MSDSSVPDLEFDIRWAAWQTGGTAHDRAGRRRLTIMVPLSLLVLAGIIALPVR